MASACRAGPVFACRRVLRDPDAPAVWIAGASHCRRLRRSYRVAGAHERSRKRRLFQREQNSSTDSQKEGMESNQKKIKVQSTQSNKKRRVRRLPLTTWQSATLRFSLCFRGGRAIPLPGFRAFETRLGPRCSAPAVLDRVSRCKAHMLVIKAHTTYYGLPSPRTWLASLNSLSICVFFLFFFFPFPFRLLWLFHRRRTLTQHPRTHQTADYHHTTTGK